jgi:hypothetical protein
MLEVREEAWGREKAGTDKPYMWDFLSRRRTVPKYVRNK